MNAFTYGTNWDETVRNLEIEMDIRYNSVKAVLDSNDVLTVYTYENVYEGYEWEMVESDGRILA